MGDTNDEFIVENPKPLYRVPRRRSSADEFEDFRQNPEKDIPPVVSRGYDLRKESLEEGSAFLSNYGSESPLRDSDSKRYAMDDTNMNSPIKPRKVMLPYVI